jgi:ribosome assembly protein 4
MKRKVEKTSNNRENTTLLAQFYTTDGEPTGSKMSLPCDITVDQLHTLLNDHILKNEEELPYSFFVNEQEMLQGLLEVLDKQSINDEDVLKIEYQPQAVFRVRQITRCVSSMEGHSEAVLSVAFSPDGQVLATGSGDTTVRFWDMATSTPHFECKGHKNWVLCLAWSPDGKWLASGSMDKTVRIWNPTTGVCHCVFGGHSQPITSIAWEPLHKTLGGICTRLVSGSQDKMARVWDVTRKQCLFVLASHSEGITCVKWGGEGLIYTASKDRTIIAWKDDVGSVFRVLKKHGHWVNNLSLNTDYACRTGSCDHTGEVILDPIKSQQRALERYNAVKGDTCEILVSASDDTTCYLWEPKKSKQPIIQMTGHSKIINIVSFSPDGKLIASAAFDKNIRVWNNKGKHISTFRGHVQEVYQIAWASDSRLFVSGSKDSTMKVWDSKTGELVEDLPGHADEVYSVDWSPDGFFVGSGSKDRLVKIWRH